MSGEPMQLDNVSVICKANVYFGGKVLSHSVLLADGSRKTVGTIQSGSFTFNTGAPERMEITGGACRVRVAGEADWRAVAAGEAFEVPGNSSFEIAVEEGIADYVCTFLPERG